MRRYDMVLFDFDGTIMNTFEGIVYSAQLTMASAGLEVPPDTNWRAFIGPPLDDCFRIVFGIQDKDMLDRLCKTYDDFYKEDGCHKACFYPGMVELIKNLKKQGYIVGIASMKYTSLLDRMCTYFGIDDLIDCKEGQALGSVTRKPDIIRSLCSKYSVDVKRCLMVGDSLYDYEGALEAGCDGLKVNWGFGFGKDEPGAVSSADEIMKKIEE